MASHTSLGIGYPNNRKTSSAAGTRLEQSKYSVDNFARFSDDKRDINSELGKLSGRDKTFAIIPAVIPLGQPSDRLICATIGVEVFPHEIRESICFFENCVQVTRYRPSGVKCAEIVGGAIEENVGPSLVTVTEFPESNTRDTRYFRPFSKIVSLMAREYFPVCIDVNWQYESEFGEAESENMQPCVIGLAWVVRVGPHVIDRHPFNM